MTVLWTARLPFLQIQSPASLVVQILNRVLGPRIAQYTYIDFASGAGGPTPYIEQELNKNIRSSYRYRGNGGTDGEVKFILTDLAPHILAWEDAKRDSSNLEYVPKSIDAANAPRDLAQRYGGSGKKSMRLFSLAFHHFDDELAGKILADALEGSDAFA